MMLEACENFTRKLWGRAFFAHVLCVACFQPAPSFLIQDVSDPEKVFRRPEVDIDFFSRPGIGVPEACGNKLYGNTFSVQGRGEVMAECVRPEPGYPGVPGKFFTEAIQAVWCLVALY